MQYALNLTGGWHVGPLFVITKRRPLVRPKGKEGVIHRAQTIRATPTWADKKLIAEYYKQAQQLTLQTGELHVVDHIVPKCGKTVCGLHVHYNLRVCHWLENARKGAWVWPDMPVEQVDLF